MKDPELSRCLTYEVVVGVPFGESTCLCRSGYCTPVAANVFTMQRPFANGKKCSRSLSQRVILSREQCTECCLGPYSVCPAAPAKISNTRLHIAASENRSNRRGWGCRAAVDGSGCQPTCLRVIKGLVYTTDVCGCITIPQLYQPNSWCRQCSINGRASPIHTATASRGVGVSTLMGEALLLDGIGSIFTKCHSGAVCVDKTGAGAKNPWRA